MSCILKISIILFLIILKWHWFGPALYMCFYLILFSLFLSNTKRNQAFNAHPFRCWKLLHGINQLLTAYGFFFFLFLSLSVTVSVWVVRLMFGLAAPQNYFRAFLWGWQLEPSFWVYQCNAIFTSVRFFGMNFGKCWSHYILI